MTACSSRPKPLPRRRSVHRRRQARHLGRNLPPHRQATGTLPDLSKTGDDIKGRIRKFLGTTFRGELGQFFTPRPVVEFMVDLLDPQEGQMICDPASGSGGFLIRAFEHVRSQIVADIQQQKDAERARIEA